MGEQSNVSSKTCVSNKNLQNKPLICFNNFEDKFLESKLEDICTFYKGKGISKEDISPEGIPCIRYGELYTKYKENIESIFSKTNLPKETLVFSEKGDILIPTSGESAEDIATASCLNRGGIALGSDITILRTKINSLYLAYYINFKKNEIAKLAQGVSIVHLYPKDLKEYKIKYPSLEEQEKVVTFLKLIDLKINSLEKTLVLYQKIKKHILEQIFANLKCESESLDKVTFYQEGPGVRNYQYTKEGIKLLNVGNFVENELILENTDRYISEEEAYGKYKHFLVDEGDLLIACSGIKAEYFDEKITFAKKEHLPLCMNTSTMRFKTLNENKLNLNYLKWYFQTVMFKKQIFGVLTGSAQFNFGPTHLKYLKVLIPPIEQQIVISNFLDFLKNHTDKLSKEIYLMKEYKKGLLQKMFV